MGRSVGTVTSQQPCYSSDDVIKNAPKRLKQHTVQTSSSGALISEIEAQQPIWYQILQILNNENSFPPISCYEGLNHCCGVCSDYSVGRFKASLFHCNAVAPPVERCEHVQNPQ